MDTMNIERSPANSGGNNSEGRRGKRSWPSTPKAKARELVKREEKQNARRNAARQRKNAARQNLGRGVVAEDQPSIAPDHTTDEHDDDHDDASNSRKQHSADDIFGRALLHDHGLEGHDRND